MNFKVDQGEEGQKSELPALKLITNLEVKGKKYKYLPNFELNKERNDHREALLYGRLRQKLKELNKDSDGLPLTDDEIEDAIRQIHEDAFPANLDLVEANERVRTKLIGLSQESIDGTSSFVNLATLILLFVIGRFNANTISSFCKKIKFPSLEYFSDKYVQFSQSVLPYIILSIFKTGIPLSSKSSSGK